MTGRLAWIVPTPAGMHSAAWHGKSFAPMSIVTNATSWRCARRNATASSSCDPWAYAQIPPSISVVVVSPGQPSFSSESFG
jgi:hypothetical protein